MIQIDIKGDVISNDSAWLYDWIGWDYVSPSKIQKELENANGEEVEFLVNSPGGNVFAGYEIFNTIRNYEGHTTSRLIGLAASCGSFIPLASEKVIAEPMSMMMIHGASTSTYGNQRDHAHSRDFLANVDSTIVQAYTSKTGKTSEEMLDLMAKETWFTPKQMLEIGLIDEIAGEQAITSKVTVYNSTEDKKKHVLIDKLLELGNIENVKKALIENQITLGQGVVNSAIDNKNPNEEGKEMTLDQFKSENADLYNQIVNSAREEERNRINAINALAGKAPKEIIEKGIAENQTAEQVALAALMAQPVINQQAADAIKADAEESGVDNVGGTSTPTNADAEEKANIMAQAKTLLNRGGKR